jgi:hypothetical protein
MKKFVKHHLNWVNLTSSIIENNPVPPKQKQREEHRLASVTVLSKKNKIHLIK